MSGLLKALDVIGELQSEGDVRRALFIAHILTEREVLREGIQQLEHLINHVWKVSLWKRRRFRKRLLNMRRTKLQFINDLLDSTDLFGRRDSDGKIADQNRLGNNPGGC